MMLRGLLLGSALLLLAGCTHQPGCPGAGNGVAKLQCRAGSGDKLAQLELGRRYEMGEGVTANPKQAARLYRRAAQAVAGTTYVYSPSVGKRGRGMVLPVRIGADQPGLAEAKYRLGMMYAEGRGVKRDIERAAG